ncbi:MAG: hypothetical protein RIE73_14210 [Coleofasciculus sp. C1-SOL-03]
MERLGDGEDGGDGGHLDLLRLRSVTRSVCQMGKMRELSLSV